MIWTEQVRLRQFGLDWVVICPQGSGCIVVDCLLSLVIYLSVCGLMLVWMCVSTILADAQPSEPLGCLDALQPSVFILCVFSCSSYIFIFCIITFTMVAAQSINNPSNHSSTVGRFSSYSVNARHDFHLKRLSSAPKEKSLKMLEFVSVCGLMKGC